MEIAIAVAAGTLDESGGLTVVALGIRRRGWSQGLTLGTASLLAAAFPASFEGAARLLGEARFELRMVGGPCRAAGALLRFGDWLLSGFGPTVPAWLGRRIGADGIRETLHLAADSATALYSHRLLCSSLSRLSSLISRPTPPARPKPGPFESP
jgi:hypothetical protein